jgi:predicted  nucleic acid-binding Zn-ribbon protein
MKTSKPNSRFKDIAGQSFGTLTAVRFVGYNESSKQLWEFSCSVCGHTKAKVANSVTTGKGGCGCRQFAGHRRTHGKHGTREYNVWKQMRQRCNNPNAIGYANYGGRGIRVCDRWEDFAAFLADMGPAPARHTPSSARTTARATSPATASGPRGQNRAGTNATTISSPTRDERKPLSIGLLRSASRMTAYSRESETAGPFMKPSPCPPTAATGKSDLSSLKLPIARSHSCRRSPPARPSRSSSGCWQSSGKPGGYSPRRS